MDLIALDRQGRQQQRPESPTVTLTWHASEYEVQKSHQRHVFREEEEEMEAEFVQGV